MKSVNDLADLLVIQLEELRCTEESLIKTITVLIKKNKNIQLNNLLDEYKISSEENLIYLNSVFDILEITPDNNSLEVIDGLIEITKKIIKKIKDNPLLSQPSY